MGRLNQTIVPEVAKVFTTGKVASLLKVAPRTVSKWFDSGRLRGYRIPGSQDRRIPESCLFAFIAEHALPFPDEVGFIVTDGSGGFVLSHQTGECIANESNPVQAARKAQRFPSQDEAMAIVNVRASLGLAGKVVRVTDVVSAGMEIEKPAPEAVSV